MSKKKIKLSKKSKEDRPVTIDNNLPFDQFIDKYAKKEDVYFKNVTASVSAVSDAEAKANSRPAYVIENLTLKVKNLSIGLKDMYSPDTFVFRNCTFVTVHDIDSSFITLEAEKKAEFENCSFKAADRTCFTVEPFADLNITGSDAFTILVQGLANSDIRIADCDIANFLVMSAENLHFVSKLPYTATIDQTTSVSVSNVDEYPEHPNGSYPMLTVKNGTNGSFAVIRITDSSLAANRVVYIQDSVYSVCATRSHIGTLVIIESLIRQLCTTGSTVDMLKAVESTLLEMYYPNLGELRNSAITKSHGFPDRPMVLYKKARMRILNVNPFASDFSRTEEVIVKLSVPSSAQRHYDPMSKKIRVSEAVVAGFYDMEHKEIKLSKIHRLLKRYLVTSFRDDDFKYWLDKTVKPLQPFADNDDTCASGIHGFVEFDDAVSYSWP